MSASSISITFTAEGNADYIEQVTELTVGNMVDPETGVFWFQPPAVNPWEWSNNGSNDNSFGLMANYKYTGLEKTALSKVVICPQEMSDGSHKVEVTLCTAAVQGDENNTLLRFKSVTVDGETQDGQAYINEWGSDKPQPVSDFYDCP